MISCQLFHLLWINPSCLAMGLAVIFAVFVYARLNRTGLLLHRVSYIRHVHKPQIACYLALQVQWGIRLRNNRGTGRKREDRQKWKGGDRWGGREWGFLCVCEKSVLSVIFVHIALILFKIITQKCYAKLQTLKVKSELSKISKYPILILISYSKNLYTLNYNPWIVQNYTQKFQNMHTFQVSHPSIQLFIIIIKFTLYKPLLKFTEENLAHLSILINC